MIDKHSDIKLKIKCLEIVQSIVVIPVRPEELCDRAKIIYDFVTGVVDVPNSDNA